MQNNVTNKKILTPILLFSIIILVIIIAVYNEITLKPFDYNELEKNVYQFQTYDAQLNEGVVLARFGLLEQYDPIVSSVNELSNLTHEIKSAGHLVKGEHFHQDILKLEEVVQNKRALVEDFKTTNSTLRLAILHFSNTMATIIESQTQEAVVEACLSGSFSYQIIDLTNTIYRDMLTYVNNPNQAKHDKLTALVTKIKSLEDISPELNRALGYADLILMHQPELDKLSENIYTAPTISTLSKVNDDFTYEFNKYQKWANVNRILLTLFSFILLGLLTWAFRRLQVTISQLNLEVIQRKQAQEELAAINLVLEQKVAERTQELTVKNKDLEIALQELKEAQAQVVLHEKMASVGMLTAGISHELKNPLNFVNNFSEISLELLHELKEGLIKYQQSPSTENSAMLQNILEDLNTNSTKILEHGKRADKIVQNMMLHSQTSVGTKENVEINKLIEEQIDLAYHNIMAKDKDFFVDIVKELQENVGKCTIIPQTFGRAILNIALNAMYYVNEKRKKHIPSYQPYVTISSTKVDSLVTIKIRDNGMGIPQKDLGKIFEPFFTTKPTGEGTGLGLSICYDTIVKEHGGEIQVNSVEGEYTEFTITLPCKKE